MDLTTHIPDDSDWIEDYAAKIGWQRLIAYYERVFLMLLSLPVGAEFNIVERVDPNHYDLFIKCTYTAMTEVAKMQFMKKSYYIEKQSTLIIVR